MKEELRTLGDNTKGRLFLRAFRRSQYFTRSRFLRIIGAPYRLYYKLVFNYILGIDIPDITELGYGFTLYHGQGLVVNPATKFGKYVVVRQNTTIGNARQDEGSPVIGDYVEIGANAVIIGEISIGHNSIIAAGAVVLKSFPPNVIIAGNPARIVKQIHNSV